METRLPTKLTALLITIMYAATPQAFAENKGALRVSENSRFLVREDGSGFFPVADTAWALAWKLSRQEIDTYFQRRKEQRFNTVALVAFPSLEAHSVVPNKYGDYAFEVSGDRWEPGKPLVTQGGDPNDPAEYDYWDHLEYVVDTAESKGMYLVLLPAWGDCVAGSYGEGAPTGEVIFDESSAYGYGEWIGRRFGRKSNIIWMLGGDRNPVYGERDYRNVFRAMAEGIADGVNGTAGHDGEADYSTTLMSYHPRKWQPNSSEWFHHDPWLDFNSIQDQPSDQVKAVNTDYGLLPAKPTWLLEGGYECRKTAGSVYGEWQLRFQSYQTVFAGGFGVTYGSMNIYGFGNQPTGHDEPVTTDGVSRWEASLEEPGALDMQHLLALMTSVSNEQFLDRIPDQVLVEGDTGTMTGAEGTKSSCIQATRGAKGDYAMIYSADGRSFRVNMERLAAPLMNGFWFNPRNGRWQVKGTEQTEARTFLENIPSGPAAVVRDFDPPGEAGDGNDWVLVLKCSRNPAR